MGRLKFSGHESFQCRNLWLKKGYDFINQAEQKDFNDDRAVIDLGVGKNMTTAIRYWMDAFGMRDEDDHSQTSELANKLLSENGWDPFLEDIGSLWLLHYLLVNKSRASIYHLVFNRFRRHRIEFTKEHLKNFLISRSHEEGESHSPNTIETDIGVFLKSYVRPRSKEGKGNIEDQYSSLLMELDLVKEIENLGTSKGNWYKIESSEQESLPIEVFLFSLLDNIDAYGKSISIHKLLNENNSPGNIFALHPDALVSKVEQLTQFDERIVYKEDGGIRELQFNNEFSKYEILDQYYARN